MTNAQVAAPTNSSFINTFIDTRGLATHRPTFARAIVEGIALGGGLFVPQVLPKLSLEEILALGDLRYSKLAAYMFRRFGVDFDDKTVDDLMETSYGSNFDTPAIAPVVSIDDDTYVLELWHGPTSAFKDLALQCMPNFFSAAIDKLRGVAAHSTADFGDNPCGSKDLTGAPASASNNPADSAALSDFLILVATSGDTGKAALEGFKDRPHTNIICFYPDGGVSDIQQRQMTTQLGNNVGVFGVRGNFDECQTAVKETFTSAEFAAELSEKYGLQLSSANSINWGRLMPQIIYYVSAYTQLVKSGDLGAGEELDVCVPTGNFGNILAAYYAKELGVPIGRLLCASNNNNVLTDFINTGTYDISRRELMLTASPSMDILVSSNVERQLFELSGRNAEAIRTWMDELKNEKRFRVDKETFAQLRANYSADWVDNAESLQVIREVWEKHNYLMDPHTAVAWRVAERLRSQNPVLVVSTAHWAKFGADVYRALNGLPTDAVIDGLAGAGAGAAASAGAGAGAGAASATGSTGAAASAGANGNKAEAISQPNSPSGNAIIEHIESKYHPTPIPAPLNKLKTQPERFNETISNSSAAVMDIVRKWLHTQRQITQAKDSL